MKRFTLGDGSVHVGISGGPTLCCVTIPKYRRSTDADITCETCINLGPFYGVNVGRLNVEKKSARLAAATVVEPEIVEVDLRCVCGAHTQRPLDGDAPARATLAALSCGACGRLGKMSICSPPDDEPRELPAHPEEP